MPNKDRHGQRIVDEKNKQRALGTLLTDPLHSFEHLLDTGRAWSHCSLFTGDGALHLGCGRCFTTCSTYKIASGALCINFSGGASKSVEIRSSEPVVSILLVAVARIVVCRSLDISRLPESYGVP